MSDLTSFLAQRRSSSGREAADARPWYRPPFVFWTLPVLLLVWIAEDWYSQTQTRTKDILPENPFQKGGDSGSTLNGTGPVTLKAGSLSTLERNHKYEYSFKTHATASLTESSVSWCQGAPEVRLQAVDTRLDFLLVIGVQKAGTTWLFDALATHPLFSGAEHGYRRGHDRWAKEVHFFDQMPPGTSQEFLECFAQEEQAAAIAGKQNVVFLDATPAYLRTPAAAPRVKQSLPHAKFVIILRDPVARYLSAYAMIRDNVCMNSGDFCDVPSLTTFAESEMMQEGLSEDCLFQDDVEPADQKTWSDCFRCKFTMLPKLCKHLAEPELEVLGGCPVASVPMIHTGLYAVQIAWWLSFFPPERFLILSSSELRDPAAAVKALNRILAHTGHHEAEPFTQAQVEAITGFQGNYSSKEYSLEDTETMNKLAELYRRPNQDLQNLMDEHFSSVGFTGFQPEM